MGSGALVEIRDLAVWYRVYGGLLKVLDGVNLTVASGQKVGIVGETGCGKTTTMKAILRILPRNAVLPRGEVMFQGRKVLGMRGRELQELRGQGVAMIFQDPTAALNPVFTVGQQIMEVIKYARAGGGPRERRLMALSALKEAALPDPERIMENYPFQLSGGMRQRVCIAMALATARTLLIADEPTTNLDVTIQDQVLRLMRRLVQEKGTSLILITHSLGVAREMTDLVYVMYAGTMVEVAPTDELFESPLHPYTVGLLRSIPKLTGGGIAEGVPGRIPNYADPPPGCRFAPRCSRAMAICSERKPEFFDTGGVGHRVACWLFAAGGGAVA
ncbi:MAG: ABC transporter ATP-binding protein [Bacillota bacterium]|nr:ABC transporter ATP-binding protein [Bacillota bacterium]MDI7248519.1 ABC transporter ATP-binding protein [Bacillota bacterium]